MQLQKCAAVCTAASGVAGERRQVCYSREISLSVYEQLPCCVRKKKRIAVREKPVGVGDRDVVVVGTVTSGGEGRPLDGAFAPT